MRCKVSVKGHKPLDLQDCKKNTLPFPKLQLERKWLFLKIQTLKVWKTHNDNSYGNVPSYDILKYFELLFALTKF